MKNLLPMLLFSGLFLTACNQNKEAASEPAAPVTPVQVTYVKTNPLSDFIELNAVSSYLQKSYVKANINGYVQFSGAQLGKEVGGHEILFTLITKEARAIGNAVNQLDPGFKFSGISKIRAEQSGFITQVNHQRGDYVQDGEALAVISNRNSLVFLLDLPYEFRSVVDQNKNIELILPDGEKLKGTLGGAMPSVDSAAQTQRIMIRVNPSHTIPEGLIAKVRITRTAKSNAQTLPKSAVLANETEDEFWVMKLINDSTAVKVPIKKGIENAQFIEILDPVFNSKDRIITTGNYGIADTAKVKVDK
ncbi:efflux RND transporter periplasmic adaptor subunit [Pedobacter nutrimenti]|uniref:efflux RND transporter periplasmic adaptor subunit n=1 Tax=Pedobacter nutrimenti TaxID=1241337 RepID=UPI002930501A|nr:HlyD family efflux transporter periplasmic adaptor subunit [Pedobacter nutrimenti]